VSTLACDLAISFPVLWTIVNIMQFLSALLFLAVSSISFAENPFASYLLRVKRQWSPGGIAHGGGISMTARLDPTNRDHPVAFSTGVNFAAALNFPGMDQVHTISNSNGYGGGRSNGNAFGSVMGGFPTAIGNTDTWVPDGNGQVYTNNIGFSGVNGRGFGSGNARGSSGWPGRK